MLTLRHLIALFLGLVAAWLAAAAHAEVMELRQAQAELTVDGVTTSATVSLPYGWDYRHPEQAGVGRFSMVFEKPDQNNQLWAMYFARLGNSYAIWLNGKLLEQNGRLDEFDTSDFAKEPHLISIPAALLQPHNRLEVAIRADIGRRSGVPVVVLGPKEEVEQRIEIAMLVRLASTVVVTVFSLIVGLYAIVLWVTQTDPRPDQRKARDNLYLYAALAELSWAFFVADTFIDRPPLPWVWWAVLTNLALGLWLSSLLLFIHNVAGWDGRRFNRWMRWTLTGLMALEPVMVYIAISHHHHWLLKVWMGGFAALFLPSTILFVAKAVRGPNTMHRLVALAFVINVPIGLRDWYVIRLTDTFGIQGLLRYSAVLFGIVLAAIVIGRFRAANLQVREMMESLAARIAQKERELGLTYGRMEVIAREQARTSERARVLRDLHDGVGSHISAAIRQLESGRASDAEVLTTLRESMDQLKLTIDTMNLPPGDITALLANLRYRLEPRLKASDIELHWDVNLIEPLLRLDDKAMRQLQFMVFEAMSNVLQHAHASEMRIELCSMPDGGARLRVIDNGRGFDPQRAHPKSLGSLRERAAAIGAKLTVTSESGRTVVEIALA